MTWNWEGGWYTNKAGGSTVIILRVNVLRVILLRVSIRKSKTKIDSVGFGYRTLTNLTLRITTSNFT